jgi:phage-related protein
VKGIGVALGAAMAAIGTAAVAAGKALVDMTVNTAAYADEMLTQSSVTGMSVERLQAYSYAADLVDVSMETLTGSMAKNVKSMSNAADGSKTYAEAYERLGVSVTNADGSLRDSEDVYWDAIDALGQVSNETERDALAMQLFGKSAQDLNPLIAQGSEGIAALTDEAKRMGAVLSEDTIEKFGAFDDSVQRLKQGSEAAQRVMGTVLLPQLQTLADDGVSLLGDFTSGLAEAGGDFDKITAVLGETVGGIANMILGSLPQFVQVGMSIVSAIGGALAANLPMLVSAATSIIMTLLQVIIAALPQFTDGAVQLVTTLVQGIVDNLPALVEAAIQMIASIAQGIGGALPTLIPAIIEAVLLICETLFDNMDKILDAAFSIVKGLAEGIIRALPKLIEALPKLITGIINFFMQNLPTLMGIELTVQLAIGLIKALPQLIAALPQIVAAILNGLRQSVSSVVEIGKNIVNGLWEGIKSMASWLASKVKDFFSNIVKSAKKALGIASPSKVFAGIGENMGEGVGIGFTDAMEDVNKQIQSAIPTSVDVGAIDVLTNLPNNIGFGGTSDLLSQKLDVLIDEVRRYLPQLAGMQLVADTGATIGWLAPAMDDALGAIRRRKERLT